MREKGFGIIEMLIAVGVFMILTAMVGQGIITLVQAQHEKNILAGVQDVMTAEASYKSSYGAFVTGANASEMSTCAAGAPTATAACLTSAALTNGNAYNQYTFSITTPTDAGYLVVASPINSYAGRLTYCADDKDPLIHGIVSWPAPTVTTAAACSALPAVSQGTQSSSSLPILTNAVTPMFAAPGNIFGNADTSNAANWVQASSHPLVLPPGQYYLTAKAGILGYTGSSAGSGQVACVFSDTQNQIGGPTFGGTPPTALGEVRMYNPVPNDYYYGDLTLSRALNWQGPGTDTINLWCALPDMNAVFNHNMWIGPTVMNAIQIGQVISQ